MPRDIEVTIAALPTVSRMKLFLSYPSAQRPLADRLALALEAEGHEVFIDRSDLKAGEAFHQRLREAIEAADGMVFLITPEAVAPGSYALAELGIAQQRWRRPGGHVLPVMVVATPIAALPAYLSAVTVLQPRGEIVAETVAAVSRLAPPPGRRRRRIAIGSAVVLAVLAAAGVALWQSAERRAAEEVRVAAERQALAQAATARALCDDGSHEAALAQLNAIAAKPAAPAAVQAAREDCAMRWLRGMRAVAGKRSFGEQVAQVEPILSQGLARASGARAADLRAHVGWGEFLRGRDGAGTTDPAPLWKRALGDDAGNAYAHAMWARQMLDRPGRLAEARPHFAAAVASGRDRAFVRALQLGATLSRGGDLADYALSVADEMRRMNEAPAAIDRRRLWSDAFHSRLLDAEGRARLAAALPPADLIATFLWLYPEAEVSEEQRPHWRFVHALLRAGDGDRAGARDSLAALVRELRASRRAGRLLDEAERLAQSLA